MGKIYDDWERLVQAVLHREHLRDLGQQHSRSPSQSSTTSEVSLITTSSNLLSPGVFYRDEYPQPLSALFYKRQSKNKEKRKLVLLEDCYFLTTLVDLLSSPAELLGRGTLGTTFKVLLHGTISLVVRSLKELKAAVWEFEQQMEILGRIRHDNVLGVEAYFYFEDEKYLVYDYCDQLNVDSLLHDKTGGELRPLDRDTRLRIAIGAARGLAHIHTQCRGKLVHGNIKASNIFLNSELYGCVSDLCFAATDMPTIRYTNYYAPEVKILRKHSQASDVYSYGILLLELLTRRKSTVHARIGKEVVGLDTWVNSVTSDKGTIKVFDGELMKPPIYKEELIKVLLIAMHCVARKPELRPKMADILKMLESIRKNRSDQAFNRYINRERHQDPSKFYKDFSRWLHSQVIWSEKEVSFLH